MSVQWEASGQFSCGCGGPTRPIDAETVEHACKNRYAPATSAFDGVERYVRYRRVQVNPKLTDGAVKFNWFVDWQ